MSYSDISPAEVQSLRADDSLLIFDIRDQDSYARGHLEGGMTPLMLAALNGERALVEALLALGADPNHINQDDHHALWFACVHGDVDLVSLLIAHGADVDNQNVNGAICATQAPWPPPPASWRYSDA
jgi:ankyrin repeat protein